eukprot:Gb_17450 [translate_table: standard]
MYGESDILFCYSNAFLQELNNDGGLDKAILNECLEESVNAEAFDFEGVTLPNPTISADLNNDGSAGTQNPQPISIQYQQEQAARESENARFSRPWSPLQCGTSMNSSLERTEALFQPINGIKPQDLSCVDLDIPQSCLPPLASVQMMNCPLEKPPYFIKHRKPDSEPCIGPSCSNTNIPTCFSPLNSSSLDTSTEFIPSLQSPASLNSPSLAPLQQIGLLDELLSYDCDGSQDMRNPNIGPDSPAKSLTSGSHEVINTANELFLDEQTVSLAHSSQLPHTIVNCSSPLPDYMQRMPLIENRLSSHTLDQLRAIAPINLTPVYPQVCSVYPSIQGQPIPNYPIERHLSAPMRPTTISMPKASSTGDIEQTAGLEVGNGPVSPLESKGSIFEEAGLTNLKYSEEERKKRIHRYRIKRSKRNFDKKIKYACRKTLADGRSRVRGRFAKNEDLGEMKSKANKHFEEDEEEEIPELLDCNIEYKDV